MLCERCGKKPAVVHKIININGEKQEIHLCRECALEEGELNMHDPLSIHSMLSSLLDMGMDTPIKIGNTETVKCDVCGNSFGEFKRTGLLGCSRCYQSYRSRLVPLISRIHGNTRHSGKIPRRKESSLRHAMEIDRLRQELERAIKAEEYEKAAEVRDKIRALSE